MEVESGKIKKLKHSKIEFEWSAVGKKETIKEIYKNWSVPGLKISTSLALTKLNIVFVIA